MTLTAGTRLGPYEILSPLGAGGMGEVYKAQDTRLDRSVAIKVLPDRSASDGDLRRRFEREARTVSSLNHPHICTLHDVGREGDVDFLVMELIEGETLAERLKRGALPHDEVLRLGVQVAEGLAGAHRHGVVHRDLKPANIMLTKSGAKLLDFGLAKPTTEGPSEDEAGLSALPTHGQTLTEKGAILGTFQYMAPEQLEAKEVDARTDIFALGAVLYEMATGRRAFDGSSQASLISAIMSADPPPMSAVPSLAPSGIERVVRRCLARDPDQRWQSAADVARMLEWVGQGEPAGATGGAATPRRERLAWGLAGLAALLAVVFGSLWATRSTPSPPQVRFEVHAPDDVPVLGSPRISPDGRHLAFDAIDAQGNGQIWVRSLSDLQARPVSGTEGAGRPFWSPDSQHIGFFAQGKLKRIPLAGGPPQVICDAATGADAGWSDDGVILYDGTEMDPIMRVAAGGGTPTPFVTPEQEQGAQVGWPQFLPGRRDFLFVAFGTGEPQLRLGSLDGGERKTILSGESRVEYVPPGYLLYVKETSLVAQAFDAARGETTGEPMPLADGLGLDAVGLAHFSASRNGVLVFRDGEAGGAQLEWVDARGQNRRLEGPPTNLGSSDLSRDGRWLAFEAADATDSGSDIWVRDLVRGVTSRFTFAGGRTPVWLPEGDRVIFSTGSDPHDIGVTGVGGGSKVEMLVEGDTDQHPTSVSSDGRFLLYQDRHPENGNDIWVLPLEGREREPRPLIDSPFVEVGARFSPDGRFVSWQSNESGRFEIYVQPFPGPGRKRQISTDGGSEARWSPDGRELYYLDRTAQNLMHVAVQTGGGFEAGVPEPLFPVRLSPRRNVGRYQVHPDGDRFLLMASLAGETTPPTTVVLNWNAETRP